MEALPEAEQDVMQNLTDAMAAVAELPVVKELKQTEAAPSQKKSKNKKAKSAVAGMNWDVVYQLHQTYFGFRFS